MTQLALAGDPPRAATAHPDAAVRAWRNRRSLTQPSGVTAGGASA